MSTGRFRVAATNPTISDGASTTSYHLLQNDSDLALVPRSPVAVQTTQGDSVGGTAVANTSRIVSLEREAVQEATVAGIKVSIGEAGPGVKGIHVQGGIAKIERRVKNKVEIREMPDGSFVALQTTEAECRLYVAIFESLYLSALDSPEDAAEEEPTTADRCIDQCCQACACDFSRKTFHAQKFLQKKGIVTPTLRRAREKGWEMLFQFTFPLVTSGLRHIWVGSEFIFTIIAMVLSSIMFHLGNNAVFNIIHLVLACISFALATLDFGLDLYDRCKECCHKVEAEENGTDPLIDENSDTTGKGKCLKRSKNVLDFCRTWVAELILYPLLICDMFEFITGQGWNAETATDRLGFALFIISSGALVVYVYVVRLLILSGMIYHVQKRPKAEEASDQDQVYSASAIWVQLYFYIHVLGQMVVQILMLIGIGAKIRYENPEIANTTANSTDGEPIHISPFLWYMIGAGYILPFFGFLTFFIVTYYWVQEFPIGICLDILSLLVPTTGNADSIHNIKKRNKGTS